MTVERLLNRNGEKIAMYKDFSVDEYIVMIFTAVFGIVYRVFDDHKIFYIHPKIAMILLMFSVGYLFFNRTIKVLIYLIRHHRSLYSSEFIIKDILYRQIRNGKYPVFIVEYTDMDNKSHTKEVHSSFSVKKWKIGDRIKIKIDSEDPKTIIIPFSDFSMAVIMSCVGMIFELVLITIYEHINV